MCAIAKKFYALVENPETKTSLKNYYRTLKLVEIDLKRQSTLEICNLSSDLGMDEGKNDPIPIGLFQGTFLYLDGKKLRRFNIDFYYTKEGDGDEIETYHLYEEERIFHDDKTAKIDRKEKADEEKKKSITPKQIHKMHKDNPNSTIRKVGVDGNGNPIYKWKSCTRNGNDRYVQARNDTKDYLREIKSYLKKG